MLDSYNLRVFPVTFDLGACMHTPDYMSEYCKQHKPRACTLLNEDGDDDNNEGVVETIIGQRVTRGRCMYEVCPFSNI